MKFKKIKLLAIITALIISGCNSSSVTEVQDDPKEKGIVNAHEHMQSLDNLDKLFAANEKVGISKTLIVGSPIETILYDGSVGFSQYDENNAVILEAAQKHPDKIIAFCTFYWNDPDQLEKLQECHKKGAKGIKLYNGHGFFYEIALTDEKMMPIYAYAEANRIPILFHVNGGKFLDEFKTILDKYPKLKVICPHFCLVSGSPKTKLKPLLNEYPNIYIDISFGYIDFMKAGFGRLSKKPKQYRQLFIDYQDRILFGTDSVITNAAFKDAEWLAKNFQAYKDLLEKESFELDVKQPKKVKETYNGLSLPQEVLDKIYYQNFEELMGS